MKSDVSETLHFMIYWKYREYFAIKFSPLFLSTRLLPPTHSRIHPSAGTTSIHFLFSYISYLATDSKVYRRRRQAVYLCVTPTILRRTYEDDWRNKKKFSSIKLTYSINIDDLQPCQCSAWSDVPHKNARGKLVWILFEVHMPGWSQMSIVFDISGYSERRRKCEEKQNSFYVDLFHLFLSISFSLFPYNNLLQHIYRHPIVSTTSSSRMNMNDDDNKKHFL